MLVRLPQLETLDLHDCDLTNARLAPLGAATQLRALDISENNQVLVSVSLKSLAFSSHKQGCNPGNSSAPPSNSSTLTYPKTPGNVVFSASNPPASFSKRSSILQHLLTKAGFHLPQLHLQQFRADS